MNNINLNEKINNFDLLYQHFLVPSNFKKDFESFSKFDAYLEACDKKYATCFDERFALLKQYQGLDGSNALKAFCPLAYLFPMCPSMTGQIVEMHKGNLIPVIYWVHNYFKSVDFVVPVNFKYSSYSWYNKQILEAYYNMPKRLELALDQHKKQLESMAYCCNEEDVADALANSIELIEVEPSVNLIPAPKMITAPSIPPPKDATEQEAKDFQNLLTHWLSDDDTPESRADKILSASIHCTFSRTNGNDKFVDKNNTHFAASADQLSANVLEAVGLGGFKALRALKAENKRKFDELLNNGTVAAVLTMNEPIPEKPVAESKPLPQPVDNTACAKMKSGLADPYGAPVATTVTHKQMVTTATLCEFEITSRTNDAAMTRYQRSNKLQVDINKFYFTDNLDKYIHQIIVEDVEKKKYTEIAVDVFSISDTVQTVLRYGMTQDIINKKILADKKISLPSPGFILDNIAYSSPWIYMYTSIKKTLAICVKYQLQLLVLIIAIILSMMLLDLCLLLWMHL